MTIKVTLEFNDIKSLVAFFAADPVPLSTVQMADKLINAAAAANKARSTGSAADIVAAMAATTTLLKAAPVAAPVAAPSVVEAATAVVAQAVELMKAIPIPAITYPDLQKKVTMLASIDKPAAVAICTGLGAGNFKLLKPEQWQAAYDLTVAALAAVKAA